MDVLTRVMCVDDDRPILESFRAFPWERYHCRLVGDADNGRRALELLPLLKPQLILLDVQMPVMDGLTMLPQARKILPEVKFIIFTAFRDFEYARTAMRYGVTEYLTKGEYSNEDLGRVLLRFTQPAEESVSYRFEIERCLQLMETQLGEDISLASIAEQVGMSPNYLGNLFFQQTGVHFRDYLTQLRMERARELLLHSPLRIYEVAQQVGVQNPQYFSALFQKTYGVTPGQLRK